jgi:glycosyltransferase involved in cell wall biosynthesis
MGILILNSEYPPIGGGAGQASANIARHLVRLGHDVSVVTARFGGLAHDELDGGVAVHRIPALRRRRDRSTALEQLAFIVSGCWYATSIARRLRPDATLAFFGLPSGAIAWWLRRRTQTPYIISLRGGDVPGFRPYDFAIYHKLIGPALHAIWRDADAVVANSRGLRDLAAAFDGRIPISIIPNGVEAIEFTAGEREWDSPRLLTVGRVVHQKGLDLAMRALSGLKDLAWEWQIAGDGNRMQALVDLAVSLGISDRVHFLGWQSRRDLIAWYHRANLFLFPSRHEGMPNAVLEAMASGLPVVATRIPGTEELIVDGKSGVLVPPEDPAALREALRALLPDARRRRSMGRAAREKAERGHAWERIAAEYARLLQAARGSA